MYLLVVVIVVSMVLWNGLCKLVDWVCRGKDDQAVFINMSSVSLTEEGVDFDENHKKVYRPSTFEEYIGQEKAKTIIKRHIQATSEREMIMGHVIISGIAGTRKTTLANIIAKQLGAKCVETIASSIESVEHLRQLIQEADGGVLFIDEVHGAERNLVETIYMAMEDFKIDGEPIKPFTLIGATTELGEIIKDRKPFYERFKIRIKLDNYTSEDLGTIAKQWKDRSYPLDVLSEDIFKKIGNNAKGSPRTAIRIAETTVLFNGDLDGVLENFDILSEGYTNEDLRTLEYIAENEKGVGLNGLMSFLNTSQANYTYEIEPYLVQNRLIQRTPRGRKITESGIKKIEELRNV